MAVLHIFGDEFGTMPIADSGGPFLAAMVFLPGSMPALTKWDGRRPWLVEQLRNLGAAPQVAAVRPSDGYAKALRAKIGKMDTMARLRRMADGANRKYLNETGLRVRNYVWTYCVQQAVARAVAASVFEDDIESIRVHLDRKTLTEPERNLFRAGLARTVFRLREILAMLPENKHAKVALRAWEKCSAEPHLTWSDEFNSPEFEAGLKLAHYLAKHAGESLRKDSDIRHLDWLEAEGFRNSFGDVTDLLLSPLDPEAVERWTRATGLPEPR